MKLHTLIYTLAALAAPLLAACTADDTATADSPSPGTTLKITAEVEGTRAGLDDTSFKDGDKIGIFILNEDDNPYDASRNCRNLPATYKNGVFTLDTDFKLNATKGKVLAYYPYDNLHSVENNSVYVFASSPSADGINEPRDYLYSKSADLVSASNSSVHLTFRHVMARITFAIKKGPKHKGNGNVGKIVLRNENLYQNGDGRLVGKDNMLSFTGYLHLSTGNISRFKYDDATVGTELNLKLQEEPQNVDVMVIPTTDDYNNYNNAYIHGGGVCAYITVDGVEVPVKIKDYEKMEAGKQYTIPVTINTTTTLGDETHVYMGFNGDDGKPLLWLPWNLGADSPYDVGTLYGWGDPTGQHKEEWGEHADQGYYVTMSKGLEYYGGADLPKNISGTDRDPVRMKMGGKWRMPTITEYERLIDNCDMKWTSYAGREGVWFTSKINGNKIFIPQSKFGIDNSELDQGWKTVNNTYYRAIEMWSGTADDDDKDRARIIELWIDNTKEHLREGEDGGQIVDATHYATMPKYYRQPIRPVTE